MKNQLLGKDPDAGKDSGQEEKGSTEDEMIGWHHQLNGHEFEQALIERGQRSLVCCSYGAGSAVEPDTGVGCHSLLQGIFLTQGSNPCLLKSWTQLSDQTANIIDLLIYFLLLDPRIYLCIPSI